MTDDKHARSDEGEAANGVALKRWYSLAIVWLWENVLIVDLRSDSVFIVFFKVNSFVLKLLLQIMDFVNMF